MPSHALDIDLSFFAVFLGPSNTTKSGNEESDRRLQVVKLLTALSYCIDSYFNVLCSSIGFRIDFTVKPRLSAQNP